MYHRQPTPCDLQLSFFFQIHWVHLGEYGRRFRKKGSALRIRLSLPGREVPIGSDTLTSWQTNLKVPPCSPAVNLRSSRKAFVSQFNYVHRRCTARNLILCTQVSYHKTVSIKRPITISLVSSPEVKEVSNHVRLFKILFQLRYDDKKMPSIFKAT